MRLKLLVKEGGLPDVKEGGTLRLRKGPPKFTLALGWAKKGKIKDGHNIISWVFPKTVDSARGLRPDEFSETQKIICSQNWNTLNRNEFDESLFKY